ncbi:MAG TPA: GNAT family N-acetyltransferase [bacterium]|nr:GNAT family N-acetyltransferase [bacterium]
MDTVSFQKADIKDSVNILPLLRCTAHWLQAKGIKQWTDFLGEKGREILERRFHEGEVYKVLQGDLLVGVFVVQWDDTFWHPMKNDQMACWIHTMGLDPSWMGRGIGCQILSFVESLAFQNRKKYVRLDCGADNPRLCGFYESNGFQKAGTKFWGDWLIQLYEKQLKD